MDSAGAPRRGATRRDAARGALRASCIYIYGVAAVVVNAAAVAAGIRKSHIITSITRATRPCGAQRIKCIGARGTLN